MKKNNLLVKSFSIILVVSVLAKFTAFFSEVIIASYLGTSFRADAFNMISGIHQVFYPMLGIGIWTVFLPEYKKQLVLNKNAYADDLANKMLTIFLIASVLVTVIMLLFTKFLVTLIAPGFQDEVKQLTIDLVRISAPQYIFITIAAFYASMLQAHDKFFASQIREVVSHIPVIIVAIFFYQTYGVYILAVGILLGGIFRLLIQIPYLNWGYKYRFKIDFKDRNVIRMLKKMPSALITAAVTQLNTLVDKIMASGLPTGSVASLSYGQRLINVFSGLIAGAVTTAIYPTMVEIVAKNDMNRFKKLLIKTIYLLSAVLIPVSFASFLFSKEIVSIVFQRGAFDETSVYYTALVFSYYSIGILFTGLKDIFNNVFYSFGDTKTAMKISFVVIGLNIVLNLVLIKQLGIAGLALASSISITVGTILLFLKIKKFVDVGLKDIWLELMKIVIVSFVVCIIAFKIQILFTLPIIIRLVIAGIIGVGLYFIGLKTSKSKSLNIIILFIKGKKIN